MRFVPADSLVEGMVVGKNLYDKNRSLLIRRGGTIGKGYAERIKELGYQGVYIDDDISRDIEIKDVINDEIRMKMVETVKDVFIQTEKSDNAKYDDHVKEKLSITKNFIANIVETIIDNKDTMVNLIDLKFFDDYTFFHCVNVAVLSIVMGTAYNLGRDDLYNLGIGAVLHDIGKIFVPIEILNKPGKLTPEEYEIMKKHSEYGYNYLKETFEIPTAAYVAVLQHHEKYNGEGYPLQLAEDKISLMGRIIGITDVYDALISTRPYRKSLLPSEAMEYVMANGGVMFDVNLTQVFARKIAPFPVGTYVRLSNGYVGIVAENFEEACMRPRIKVIIDQTKKPIKPFYYNLKDDRTLRNITVVSSHIMT